MKNILFYKYVDIKDTGKLKEDILSLARKLNLLGTILIAEEGINGCVSGSYKEIRNFKKMLKDCSPFKDIEFKEGDAQTHTFKKLIVRIKNEIVASKFKVTLKNRADYIEPKKLKELLDKKEEIILIDARNDYEHKIGKFKNAVTLPISTFRQLSSQIKRLKPLKNKKIVTYCTGGIRCEKASALLKENEFNNVMQLHGGIINYGKEAGNAHWEGKCFVFDTRGAIEIDPNSRSEPISQCVLCSLPCSDLHNCHLETCDKFFVACKDCMKILNDCCSKRCRNTFERKIKVVV